MTKISKKPLINVRIYHGYGHQHNLVLYGHVLAGNQAIRQRFTNNLATNIWHLGKLFFIRPLANVVVQLRFEDQLIQTKTEVDGFFKFEWQSAAPIAAGWLPVLVEILDSKGAIVANGKGKVFVPHSTQFAFISDIDDTLLVSHSTKTSKKLKLLFTRNPRSRKAFADVVKHYQLLSMAHTEPSLPNPFFYVSSSEWNLYDDLTEFFKHNRLPVGVFVLNKIKQWHQLFKTGKTNHATKLLRIERIIAAFPKQRFVLLGDNSQSDPAIYATIADKYPERIFAIYIRNIKLKNEQVTNELLKTINNKQIYTCVFKNTVEAIAHSTMNGLIN